MDYVAKVEYTLTWNSESRLEGGALLTVFASFKSLGEEDGAFPGDGT